MRFASLNQPAKYPLEHRWVRDPLLELADHSRLHDPCASFTPYFDCLGFIVGYSLGSDFFRDNFLFDVTFTLRMRFYFL